MSGLAELLANLGYDVSGSDEKASDRMQHLARLGATVYEGHDPTHVGDADVVVVSSAIRPTNPEVLEAMRRQIPVIPRAELLAELMRLRFGIAVAGAHGKTTTTSMIALVLERAGLDPTAVIGGVLSAFGSNARLGQGEYLVAEADESDRSFLLLSPTIGVITNIDREHLESYDSFDGLLRAFAEFANKVPFYGAVVACVDDPHVAALLPRIRRRVLTYGLTAPDASLVATDVTLGPLASESVLRRRARSGERQRLGVLRLNVPGRHNVANALAAVAVGLELGLSFETIAEALAAFRGVDRRFQVCGEAAGVLVVDDYGHHPAEIEAVLAAARAGQRRRVLVAFQPHRYTRTRDLMDDFARVLSTADEVVLTDIYPAGEEPIPGITIERLVEEVRTARPAMPVHLVKRLEDVAPAVARLARSGDTVLTLGAGSIGSVGPRILAALEAGGTHAG
jgi:UDP-N-acetylmuramate--alanine ligase